MVNNIRGEIEAELDGKTFRLCLTLGALAELESRLGEDNILSLARRFERGSITASEAISIIGAGLRGGGNEVSDDIVAKFRVADGVAGYIDIVSRLLQATFSETEPSHRTEVKSSDEGKP